MSDSQNVRFSESQKYNCRNGECPGTRNGSLWLATGSRSVEMNPTAFRKLFRYLSSPREVKVIPKSRRSQKLRFSELQLAGMSNVPVPEMGRRGSPRAPDGWK